MKSETSRSKTLFTTTIAIYLAIIGIMALTGHFTFFSKTVIIPILFIVTFLAGRFVPFVKEWSIYISLIILFDAMRGFIFFLINKLQLQVYANYVITPEEKLFNGKIGSEILQTLLYDPNNITIFDKLMTFIYGSHFAFFILFSFLIWFNKKDHFGQFRRAILIVMYSGLLGYLFAPTVPPWMASLDFNILPQLNIIYMKIYNTISPQLRTAFDTNPIAAMPSLHSAFPFFITLVAFRHYKWKGMISLFYTILVFLSLVYGAQHYLLDIVAGIFVAYLSYYLAYHSSIPEKIIEPIKNFFTKSTTFNLKDIKGKLIVSFLILLIAEIAGQTSMNYFEKKPSNSFVDSNFIKRELEGKSSFTNYYYGIESLRNKKIRRALGFFKKSHQQIPTTNPYYQKNLSYFAQTAFISKDFLTASTIFSEIPLPNLPSHNIVRYAISLMETGKNEDAFKISESAIRKFPNNVELLYLRCRAGLLTGQISEKDILKVIQKLDKNPSNKANQLKEMLLKLINRFSKSS